MPTYVYACTECDHRFEAQQAFSDASLTECPNCGGKLRKVFNSVGIVFKGSGFYRNDSRGKNGSSESAGSTPAGSTSSDSSSSTSSTEKSSTSTEKSSTPAAAPAKSSSSSSGSSGSGSSSSAGSAA